MFNDIKSMLEEVDKSKEAKDLFIKENEDEENELLLKSRDKMVEFFDKVLELLSPLDDSINIKIENPKNYINKSYMDKLEINLICYKDNRYAILDKGLGQELVSSIIPYFEEQISENTRSIYADSYYESVGIGLVKIKTLQKDDGIINRDKKLFYEHITTFLLNKDRIEEEILKEVARHKRASIHKNEEEITHHRILLNKMNSYISE